MEDTSSILLNSFSDFTKACNYFGIEVNNNQLDLFKKYHEILLKWNKNINLISRASENQLLEKHFLDSILFLPEIETLRRSVSTALDIGSGGGFPAIPLAIMKDWNFTLCESTKKKASFLKELVKELNFEKRVRVIADRAESLSSKNNFNFITARGVAKLDELIHYALPLLNREGYLLAYKAKDIDDEIKIAKEKYTNKIELKIFSKKINDIERKLVTIKKIK